MENQRSQAASSLRRYVRAPDSRTPQCQESSSRKLVPESSHRGPASRLRHPSPQCPPSPSLRAPHHALELLPGATGRVSAQLANPLQVSPSWDTAEDGNAPFLLNTADVATLGQLTPITGSSPRPRRRPRRPFSSATSRSADPSGGCRAQHQGGERPQSCCFPATGPRVHPEPWPPSVHVPSDSRSCWGP